MKPLAVSALAALLTLASAPAQEPVPPAVRDGHVKVRVEVEVRGLLKVAGKSAVVLTRHRLYDQWDPTKELPRAEAVPPLRVELDFTRHPELWDLAKVLDGGEVAVTGLGELRPVTPPPPGFTGSGGFGFHFPPPTWHLMPTVLVTGLKLVPAKR